MSGPPPHQTVAAVFTVAGALHFIVPQPYEKIVPPGLGSPRTIVYASGVAEIAGGLGALPRRLRPWAGLWLVGVLVGVLPANVYHAVAADRIPGQPVPRPLLWLRVPLQGAIIAWVWRATAAGRALRR
jgi:uncharacterized membrane protein